MDSVDRAIFNEALVLLGEDGAPFFTPGKDVAYYVEGPSWINNHIHVLRPMSCDGRFLKYALNSVDYANYITGATRDKLTQDDLKQIEVPNPPLEDQRRIADFLDAETARIDHVSGKFTTFRERLAERRNAVSEDALGWLVAPSEGGVRLKGICRVVDVRAGVSAEVLPLLSVSIHRGVVPRSEMTDRLARADSFENYKICATGDIVLNRMRAFQGAVGVGRLDGLVSPDYLILRSSGDIAGDLLHHIFRSPRFIAEMASRIRGIGSVDQGNVRTPRINWEDLGDIRVRILPAADQKQLLSVLEAEVAQYERLRGKIDHQLSLLAERRQALITAAVTGQFDVTTASGRNVADGVSA